MDGIGRSDAAAAACEAGRVLGTEPDRDDRRDTTGWGHVPGLDGVRGVAVIAVLLFHGGVSWARGGFLGVDAFFVLSGLLITSLLLDESARSDAVDLAHFWARRARRLLPALLALIVVSGAYAAVLAPRGSLAGLRRDAMATLLYVANWRYIEAGADYFEATAAPSILRHTWSLAIEEQFYLVWPLVLFGVARRRARVALTAAIAATGIAASASAMAVLFEPGQDASRVYYGTDTHVQVVLTGALLAAVLAALRARGTAVTGGAAVALGAAAAIGAAGFVAAVVGLDGSESLLYRGGFLAVAVGVAALLAHVVLVPGGWSSKALSLPPLRGVGLISYGLYLWHWPVFLTLTRARTGLGGIGLLAAKLAVSALLAIVSYFAIERPIRRGALPGLRALVAVPAAMAIAAAAVTIGTEPPPSHLATTAAAVQRTVSGFPKSRRPARPTGQPARVLVVGDSVAQTLAKRLERPSRRAGLAFTNKGVLGCGVVRGGPLRYFGKQLQNPRQCQDWPKHWSEHVNRFDPDVALVIVGRWEVMDRMFDGRWTQLGDPAFDRMIDDELERAVDVLGAGEATVAMTTAPYFLRGERPDGGRWPEDDPARVDRFNAIVRNVASRHPGEVAVLDLNAQTSRGGQYTPVIDGVNLRFDGVHFSPEGSTWLSPWLFGALRELAPPEGGRPSSPLPSVTSIPPGPTSVPGATTSGPARSTTTTIDGRATSTTTSTTEAPPSTTTSTAVPTTTTPPITLPPP
jgi:peptidoglycan/LPS O-acetylase OafA/YrhL